MKKKEKRKKTRFMSTLKNVDLLPAAIPSDLHNGLMMQTMKDMQVSHRMHAYLKASILEVYP